VHVSIFGLIDGKVLDDKLSILDIDITLICTYRGWVKF